MFRLTIEGSTVQEFHDQLEQLYIHMVSDPENNCECCDNADCQKNAVLHELPDIVKAAFATPDEEKPAAKPVTTQEPEAEPAAPTAEEVRAALNTLRKTRGYEAVKAILTAHDADNFPSLDKSHYAAVLKEAQENG